MLTSLCLAQAQECFFDTAMAGGKSPAICSKIAKQARSAHGGCPGALNRSIAHQVAPSAINPRRNASSRPKRIPNTQKSIDLTPCLLCRTRSLQVGILYEDAGRLLREAPLKEGIDKVFAATVALKGASPFGAEDAV